jgi:hypothetical protein
VIGGNSLGNITFKSALRIIYRHGYSPLYFGDSVLRCREFSIVVKDVNFFIYGYRRSVEANKEAGIGLLKR